MLAWIASRTSENLVVPTRLIPRIVSPGSSPACAAGVLGSTLSTRRDAAEGIPIMYTSASSRIAKTRFAAGPAPITTSLFQVRCRQYESGLSASSSSFSPRCAERCAPGESATPATACSSSASAPRAASKSLFARGRFTRSTAGRRRGSSWRAGPKCTSMSDAAGRCMPGIFT